MMNKYRPDRENFMNKSATQNFMNKSATQTSLELRIFTYPALDS